MTTKWSFFKSERTDRKKGFLLTEVLVALAIYSVVLLSVVVVSNLFFKISEQLKISMLLDEEIVKLHTSIQSIVSRQWTLMATITDITDPEALSGNSITLISSIPANNQTGWVTAVSTITHDPVRKELLYLLPKDESGEIITTSVSKYLDSFSVSLIPGTDYIKYDATFCYYDPNVEQPIMQRRVEGAVRFY